jgi:hypothetical protein
MSEIIGDMLVCSKCNECLPPITNESFWCKQIESWVKNDLVTLSGKMVSFIDINGFFHRHLISEIKGVLAEKHKYRVVIKKNGIFYKKVEIDGNIWRLLYDCDEIVCLKRISW